MKLKSNKGEGIINFLGLLILLFVYLKLSGNIDWPWLWILSPIWLPIVAIIFIIVAIVGTLKIIPYADGFLQRKKF